MKHLYKLIIILLVFSASLTQLTYGQVGDDPRYDRIPEWYFDSLENRASRAFEVVTVDGYDNFYIGTDFAEGHISENPRQPGKYFSAFNIDEAHYTLDGHDWQDTNPIWGATIRGDVLSAHDSLGNLYYENMFGSPSIQGCKVVVSSNNGQTWSSSVTAISGVDKNWMAADQTAGPYSNYVYTVMTANSGGNFARSTDLGVSWQNTWNFPTQSLPGMMVCVGPEGSVQGGAVYVVTNGGSTTSSTYTFYKSTNGGGSFLQTGSVNFAGYVGTFVGGRHSVNNMRTRPYPFIAADNSYGQYRGRLYLVYASNDPPGSGNKPDIWSHYSDDGGASWSTANRVNDDLFTQNHHQFMPAIWCDKTTGRLYVKWMDTRDDVTSDSAMIYATYSDDGGQTFAPNQAISNEKMKIDCPTCGGSGTPRYQGDYDAIVSNEKVSMSAWADFRDGHFDSYVAYFPDYAMLLEPAQLSFSFVDTFYVNIPDVKLYDDLILFQTVIEQPATGTISFSYPEGFTLNTFPGTLPIVVTATEDVPVGTYDITVTGKGPNGTPVHKRSSVINIIPPGPPVADFYSSDSTVCEGDAVDFFDASIGFPSDWLWTFAGGEPSTSTDQNPAGIVYQIPGKYNVTLEVTNSSGSHDTTKTNFITVNIVPDPPFLFSEEVCEGEPVPDLIATGDSISWYDDPELSNLVHSGNAFATGQTEPGTYTYYVTQTANGCTSEADSVSLTIHPSPEVTLGDFESVCLDAEAFELTGGIPEGGIYSGPGVDAGSFDPQIAGAGTHMIYYSYTNEFGCTDSAAAELVVFELPEVMLTEFQGVCQDEPVFALTGGMPEGGIYSGPGVEDGMFDPAAAGVGTHEIFYVYTDSNNCSNIASEVITVHSLPAILITEDMQVCSYETVVLEASSLGAVTYQWQPGDLSGASITVDSATAGIGFGTVPFTVIVTDINGCVNSEVVNVTFADCTGIGELSDQMDIKVYPNPNSGDFVIEMIPRERMEVSIRLIGSDGRQLLHEKGIEVSGKYQRNISLRSFSPGVVMLIIESDGMTWQDKIILEK